MSKKVYYISFWISDIEGSALVLLEDSDRMRLIDACARQGMDINTIVQLAEIAVDSNEVDEIHVFYNRVSHCWEKIRDLDVLTWENW